MAIPARCPYRVGISVTLNDPKVTKVRVFWTNHADSTEFPVQVTPGMQDTFYVTGLQEGVVSFDIRTYD